MVNNQHHFALDMDEIMRNNPVPTQFLLVRLLCGFFGFLTIRLPDLLGINICVGLSIIGMVFGAFKVFSAIFYEAIPMIKASPAWIYLYNHRNAILDFFCNSFKNLFISLVNFCKNLFQEDFDKEDFGIKVIKEPMILDSYPNQFFANATYCDDPRGRYLNQFDKGRCELNVSNDWDSNTISEYKPHSVENIMPDDDTDINDQPYIVEPDDDTDINDQPYIVEPNENNINDRSYINEMISFNFELYILIGVVILILSLFLILKRRVISRKLRLIKKMTQVQMKNRKYSKTPYLREISWVISFIVSLVFILIADLCRITNKRIPEKISTFITSSENIVGNTPIYTPTDNSNKISKKKMNKAHLGISNSYQEYLDNDDSGIEDI